MSQHNNVVPLASPDDGKRRKDRKRASMSLAALPAPLRKLQDKSRQALIKLLQGLFDNADDALFALADKALTNGEQNLYFESMRGVRLQRREIEANFSKSIPESFIAIVAGQTDATSSERDSDVSEESLSLVQNDELEERVAIDGMVAKVMSTESDEIPLLCQRVGSLVPAVEISAFNLPIGPHVVCENFQKASRCLEIDIRSKLVLYKLFEKSVLAKLEPFYKEWNALLSEQGVLPTLQASDLKAKSKARKQAVQHTPPLPPEMPITQASNDDSPSNGNGQLAAVGEIDHQAFANMQQMLAQQQSSVLAQELFKTASWFLPGASPELPQSQLLGLLGQAQATQHGNMATSLDRGAIENWQATPLDVHSTLKEMLAAENINERRSLGQLEFDAINLVSMLFQFILEDGNLAEPMKALIAQLQIPLLKVAMLDSSFFGSGGHPARKLLNNIATAALGWAPDSETDRDPLLDKIESIVNTLLQDFDEDLDIFNRLQLDFDAFQASEARRASLLEKRAVDAANGKARSHQARLVVQKKLGDRVLGRKLPVMVVQLLREAWSNVLFLACVKDGLKSEAWSEALATADLLIWSVVEDAPDRSRKELLKKMPELLKKLRLGLSQISYDPFKMNQLFAELEKIHLSILAKLASAEELSMAREKKASAADLDKNVTLSDAETQLHRESDNSTLHMAEQPPVQPPLQRAKSAELSGDDSADKLGRTNDIQAQKKTDSPIADLRKQAANSDGAIAVDKKQAADTKAAPHNLSAQHKDETDNKAELNATLDLNEPIADSSAKVICTEAAESFSEVVEKFDLLGDSEKQFKAPAGSDLTVESEYYEQAKALRVGSWVELSPPGERAFRAKLAAITPPNDNYIFVNRSGMKVAEKPRLLVAAEFKSKQIVLLDDSAIFDRALESVIGGLRSIKKPVV